MTALNHRFPALWWSFWTLWDLYRHGGIEVRTVSQARGADAGNQQILAKTVVQPDADVITKIATPLLDQPEVWREHFELVRRKLRAVSLLRLAGRIPRLLLLVPPILAVADLLGGPEELSFWGRNTWWAPLMISAMIEAIRDFILEVGRWVLIRQLPIQIG